MIPVVVAVSVLARLPFLSLPAGADEAGYLQIAAQWSRGGGSLYGHYWVDRPPLLISLFQLADLAGGLVALRLLGCVAVVAVVLLVARTSARLGGPNAGRWSAVVAAALLVTPLLDAQEVNGELLSAPFVALGVLGFVAATQSPPGRRRIAWSWAAGSAAVAALLVKQNVADVLVFGSVFLIVQVLVGRIPAPAARRVTGGAAFGGLATVMVTALWTMAHGTSPLAVFDATYPFRLHAAQVLAGSGAQYATGRLSHIGGSWLLSGLAILTVLLVVGALRARVRNAALTALAATAGYDAFSVAMGGGYWQHYLVEMVIPLAIGVGVLTATRGRMAAMAAMAVAAVAVVSVVTTTAAIGDPGTSTGQRLGAAIGRAAQPGDSLTTLYGQPQANLASGLPSPYQHLWSLPIKTLDPRLAGLDAVLSGPRAPTWLIVIHEVASWGLDSSATQVLISSRYHPVGELNGQTVYLLDGADRTTPVLPSTSDHAAPPSQVQP